MKFSTSSELFLKNLFGASAMDVITLNRGTHTVIYFNISANVGMYSPNKVIDVQLVQLGYYCMSQNPEIFLSPDDRTAYAAVKPGDAYSGQQSEALSKAIMKHARSRESKLDGHISRMPGMIQYKQSRNSEIGFMLTALNNNIYDVMKNNWPRIDFDHRCPPELSATIRDLFKN